MAKGDLHAVIRLTKREVDDLRRHLGERLREEQALMEQDQRLDEALAREAGVADAEPAAAYTFANYLEVHRRHKQAVAEGLAAVRARIDAVREALAEVYRRLKTYELAQEARDARAAEEQARKDQAVLDEVALTMHRQRQDEEDEEDGTRTG
ncbi:flagellar export protein FliJ [Roseospira visakhapatnamensis]|uniref:Flagellar FliJ protein n=1 Tax=Roseospira visakhapatnamensis TaxID=390880 RepID=A0A7W6WA40_9PROT|nr:flagellar export protein FliJ [Roseospira visakhapatnamensis]MBB4266076.1 flagellar export protein FliJ [Roseospira visakhapatnamensis]